MVEVEKVDEVEFGKEGGGEEEVKGMEETAGDAGGGAWGEDHLHDVNTWDSVHVGEVEGKGKGEINSRGQGES